MFLCDYCEHIKTLNCDPTLQISQMAVNILPLTAKVLLGLFCNSNCFRLCPHTRLNSSSNVKIVVWLVSMTAVWVFVGFALTLSFGLANRDYNNNILLWTHGPYHRHKITKSGYLFISAHYRNDSKALYPHHSCIVICKSTENGCPYSSASHNRW